MFLLGCVLLYSVLSKANAPKDTLTVLGTVFSQAAAKPMLYALLAVEAVLGAALVTFLVPRLTLAISCVLFASFFGWIIYLDANDILLSCGCGFSSASATASSSESPSDIHRAALIRTGMLLGVNVCALGLAFFVFYKEPGRVFGRRFDKDARNTPEGVSYE